jgi:hypothetical protein
MLRNTQPDREVKGGLDVGLKLRKTIITLMIKNDITSISIVITTTTIIKIMMKEKIILIFSLV